MNLISKPLNKYKNASTDFKAHENSKTHVDGFKNAEIFKLIYEKKNNSINIQLDKNLKHSIQITRNGLNSITKTLIFLAKQNLAFRGHRDDRILRIEDLESNETNFGNFNSLLLFRIESGKIPD
jgi:hypothetical protein